jgi:3',5'-cyclic AMP phosphodiesterase CpdA
VTRIAHLSDLHFGAHDPAIAAASAAWVIAHRPDLVIISGDLTQRARARQFRAAGAFLEELRAAGLLTLVVPGNHDVPLYDIVRRFGAPLDRYRRYVSDDLCSWFENDEVAVLGINTARSLTFVDGRINRKQMEMVQNRFAAVAAGKTRILVTHHPLYAMPIGEGDALNEAVGRHRDAVKAVSAAGVHLALAGHFHRTFADTARRMVEDAGSVLVIQAGTATSTRLRGDEGQSFNWIHAHRHDHIELQVIAWNGSGFARGQHVRFSFGDAGWVAETVHHPATAA